MTIGRLPGFVLIVLIGVAAAGCAGGNGGAGAQIASSPAAYDWDALAAYQGQPRVDYPGPAIHGNTGMGAGGGGGM